MSKTFQKFKQQKKTIILSIENILVLIAKYNNAKTFLVKNVTKDNSKVQVQWFGQVCTVLTPNRKFNRKPSFKFNLICNKFTQCHMQDVDTLVCGE